ncbi:sensor histidine kinase [Cohnella sp.]|uniref:sensor histidine kinase n=1 Tax=Cohnella sp. TaxID=1883426 RepID=UPI00356AF8FE
MPGWKNIRFRNQLLVVFILLSSLPALLIGGVAYRKSSETMQRQTEQDLKVILGQLSTSVEGQIGDFDRFTILPYYLTDIFQFLNRPYVSEDQWGTAEIQAQRTMARLMSAYPSINSSIGGLLILGMNGSVSGYRTAGVPTINPEHDITSSKWYRDVLEQQGGFVITGIQDIDAFKGEPFRAIVGSRMLRDENFRPLAVIVIFISSNFIPKLVKSLELPSVQVVVKDREGNMVYASNQELASGLLPVVAEVKEGTWEKNIRIGDETVRYSGVFQESDYLGWDIYLGVNHDEMLKASRSIRNYTVVLVAILVIFSVLLSWLLARNLSQPISRIIRSMHEVELGQFNFPSTTREDEIGLLEKSYGKMVGRLKELIYSIEEKERQKTHAELYALRARIQPHFLYNTLNSIRMLAILQQSTQIAKLIQSLSKLLQANMKLDSELVTLEEEIRLLRDYAMLMDLRYTNVFDLDWRIQENLLKTAVPPMLLQPILENAIFHGARGLERKLMITVAASLDPEGKEVIIEITDNGAGAGEIAGFLNEYNLHADTHSTHIGLRNVRDRISLRFGPAYGLAAFRQDGKTVIRLNIPFKSLQQEGDNDVEYAGC